MRIRTTTLAILSCGSLGLASGTEARAGDITVPPEYAVDVLVDGQIDGVTPRLEAIRNSAYGTGVITASAADGVVTVRRLHSDGSLEFVATIDAPENDESVKDVAFDTVGFLDAELIVSVSVAGNDRTRLFRVAPDGTAFEIAAYGSSSNYLNMSTVFAGATSGFPDGLYLFDTNYGPEGGSSIWRYNPDGTSEELFFDTIVNDPPGRIDMDVRAITVDVSGKYGGGFIVCDNDTNDSNTSGLYRLDTDFNWSTIYGWVDSETAYLRDAEIGSGGLLDTMAFIVDGTSDTIDRVLPDGTREPFASGFDFSEQYDGEPGGAASLTISADGNIMYVADDQGIYRIRPVGDIPGPTLLCTEPQRGAVRVDEGGLPSVRLIWNEAVTFDSTDLTVTDENDDPISFAAFGSGTQFMLITFAQPVAQNAITVTVADSVRSEIGGISIDGDGDGVSGGDAEMTFLHRCRLDVDGDGLIGVNDLLALLAAWGSCL